MMCQSPKNPAGILIMWLPGPTRKRDISLYKYSVQFRNPHSDAVGCLMTWEVLGGRIPYQIALERTENDELHWHCTCADACYRGERDNHHICKHVRGLHAFLPGPLVESGCETVNLPAASETFPAALP